MSSTTPMAPGLYTTATGGPGSLSTSPYLSTAGVVWNTGMASNALTLEESEELKQLEAELSLAKRNQRIAIFKSMPTDIRQSVVNQLILEDALQKMTTCDGEGFELNTRLAHLKARAAPSFGYSGIAGGVHSYGYSQPNHHAILEFLIKEEVINAHLEQCVEDSLLNTQTDSI